MLRSFLPVGQGAFYCECFGENSTKDKINIVYDCGSQTDVKIVEQEIQNNFQKGETIEALFISHLHDDHINGIPYLLRYCNVRRIYFPLITAKNRKLMEIYYLANNRDSVSFAFFRDPRAAVRAWALDSAPVLIGIDESDQEDEGRNMQLDDSAYQPSGKNVLGGMKYPGGSGDTAYKNWLYVPFNFRQTTRVQVLLDNLRNEFGRWITEDEVERLWTDDSPEDRDKIRRAYEKVPGKFNTNSMTLFSGLTDQKVKQYKEGFDPYWFWFRRLSGCLYTGDYDASGPQKWKQLKDAYQKYWNYIGCVQVPHHGSSYNFNSEFLTMDSFFVISAGYKNKYHHPHASVVKAFLMEGIRPFIVTEHTGSAVYLAVR